jgi:5-methylcytosine-specific restriction protein A
MTSGSNSSQRAQTGGWANPRELPKGPNGRSLCRRCGTEVPRGRRTFCSAACVHEWKLRTDPGYLREKVFERDRGVCAGCGVDATSLRRHFLKLDYKSRHRFLLDWGLKEGFRKSLWDADHIIPVAEGGGECDLENMRTLCLKCHRAVTELLRLRLGRIKANQEDKAATI